MKYRPMTYPQAKWKSNHLSSQLLRLATLVLVIHSAGCSTLPKQPGSPEARRGDEIVVAGKLVHTGTPVVLWMDPGGYDAYRVERRFSPFEKSDWDATRGEVRIFAPNRYGMRARGLTDEEIERVRGGGWDLPLLQKKIDQFVIHFDVAGVSRNCFKTLHDYRGLSVQFMLDIDGTIYQTLDLKERASHATKANDRSVGIEIANMGSYSKDEKLPFDQWYKHENGQTIITIPKALGDGGVRTKNFVGHPARPELIHGVIQDRELEQYDFTPQQYAALVKLTATLCTVLPRIECKYPTDDSGKLINHKLSEDDYDNYHGVLGHYHVQSDKVDPGPAFNWDYVIGGARKLMETK
jgi:N-acetyl-anhydromuramyl-L-alanine amidase AmpD